MHLSHRTLLYARAQLLFQCPAATTSASCPLSSQLCHRPPSPQVHCHHHRGCPQIWSRPGWSFCPSLSCRYNTWILLPQWHGGLCCGTNTQRMHQRQEPGIRGQTLFCLAYENEVSYVETSACSSFHCD